MHINIHIEFKIPQWILKHFKCQHKIVHVETNPFSDYGTKESYLYCLKCGRKHIELERTCKHEENSFGKCRFCNTRLSKFDCRHKWTKDTDTGLEFCFKCGEWKETQNSEVV